MRNRLTVTLTDIHGSRHYTVSQLVKKILLYIILGIALLIIIAASTIYFLHYEVGSLNDTINTLEEKRLAGEEEYRELELELEQKSEMLSSMEDKMDDIEERIGLKPLPESSLEERIDVASLSAVSRLRILQMLPGGYPIEYKGVTSRYGWRTHPILDKKEFHPGIDLKAARNTPVHAPADGIVEFAGSHDKSGYGKLLILSHNFGFRTFYGHLQKTAVERGSMVKKGDIIAYTGNTGMSNGPHLHYEIRYLQLTLDPTNFMAWDMRNFNNIFEKENRVKWDSLLKMLERQNECLSLKPTEPTPQSSPKEPSVPESSASTENSTLTEK